MPVLETYQYGKKGAIEAFILLQFRSLLSTGVAAPISGTASYIKWAVVFLLSFYLIFACKKYRKTEVKKVVSRIGLFSAFAICAAWISSSYPVTSNFKVLSYVIPCIAILTGISETPNDDWIRRITVPLGILCLGSVVLVSSPIGYLRNGVSFQGVFNHPNVYGVMLALFLAGYLYPLKKNSMKSTAVVIAVLVLAGLTRSRTGMATIVIIVLLYLLSLDTRVSFRVVLIVLLVFMLVLLILVDNPLIEFFATFFQKGYKDNLLYSRMGQIERVWTRFLTNPICGTGFNVPYHNLVRSYEFSFDLFTENGNLILALLGDVGILGLVLFSVAYFKLFQVGRGVRKTIFFAPFLVSMGEMAFFSTNNFAIIMYLYFGIYACDGWKRKQAFKQNTGNRKVDIP